MSRAKGFGEEQQPFDAPLAGLHSVGSTRLKIGEAGRIVIPAEMRAAMMVRPGDTVTVQVVDGEFRIISPQLALKRFQAVGRAFFARNPDVDLVEELIAERREEARREAEDADELREQPSRAR
jgi:AbrB family looped-hinge helix DNA binding protein